MAARIMWSQEPKRRWAGADDMPARRAVRATVTSGDPVRPTWTIVALIGAAFRIGSVPVPGKTYLLTRIGACVTSHGVH